MALGKNAFQRQAKSAAEKGIRRHKRDDDWGIKADNEFNKRYQARKPAVGYASEERYFAGLDAFKTNFLTGHNISDAVTGIDTGEPETKNTVPNHQRNKKKIKANRYRYKIFPTIFSTAFPDGFTGGDQEPEKGGYRPVWHPEVVAGIRLALDFNGSLYQNAVRFRAYIKQLFEAALAVKTENPGLFPAGDQVLPSNRHVFLELVNDKMLGDIDAGGLHQTRFGPSAFALVEIINSVAAARKTHRDTASIDGLKCTRKQRRIITLIDRWIESFDDGNFLLENPAVQTYGCMTPVLSPENKEGGGVDTAGDMKRRVQVK